MTKGYGDRVLEVLTLDLQGETFAVEASHVLEILDFVPVTAVPTSRPFLNGLINVRGKVVPVADLRLQFDMTQEPATVDTRIVVVEIHLGTDAIMVGLLADKVLEVTQLAAASLEETPKLGMTWRPEFIQCVGKRGSDFIIVLDIERIFTTCLTPAALPAAAAPMQAGAL